MVAKSAADGYTLLVNTNAHAYSAALLTNLPYDPLTDFVPVAALTSQSYVLVAGETAASRPTIAGRTDYALSPTPTSLPHIREGKLPLGVSSARRSRALPDVPTVAEAGVADFDFPI